LALNHVLLIHRYLKERGSLAGVPASGLPFVTISRQPGAGGHLLAHVILSDFLKEEDRELFSGWHVFDRELCVVIASDPELHASMETLLAEEQRSDLSDYLESLFTGRPRQYLINRKTFAIVRLLGTLGKVILVGRAGACVCQGMAGGVHLRLVAPQEVRQRWLAKKFKVDKEAARALMRRQQADGERLVRGHFNRDINDPLLYDAVWNTATADFHTVSMSVIDLIKRRFRAKKEQ
jgi:cytidylate kinase